MKKRLFILSFTFFIVKFSSLNAEKLYAYEVTPSGTEVPTVPAHEKHKARMEHLSSKLTSLKKQKESLDAADPRHAMLQRHIDATQRQIARHSVLKMGATLG